MAKRRPADKRHTRRGPVPLPDAFVARMRATLGDDDATRLCEALGATPPCSVRLNPAHAHHPDGERVPWCPQGRYLEQRPVFTLDPLFHAGAYYVQEAASMLIEQAFQATDLAGEEVLALDLCAAPGGKSGHLRNLLHPSSLLISNEVVPARADVLAENLWKQGALNTIITRQQASFFGAWGERFDLILLDAPCSGEGLMRKDHFARQQWSEKLVAQCADLQHGLLDEAWSALHPGGYLFYSTCTWSPEENGAQIATFRERSGAELITVHADPSWHVRAEPLGLRCYPHECRGEGFFLSALRKPGARSSRSSMENGTDPLEIGGVMHVLSPKWHPIALALERTGDPFVAGFPIATTAKNDRTPHPAAAYSRQAREELARILPFDHVDLDRSKALAVLRGESLPARDAQGWALARYEGSGLAWLKGAGTRWNNHLPKPWRIRMRPQGA